MRCSISLTLSPHPLIEMQRNKNNTVLMYILAYILYRWYMYSTRVCSRSHLLAYLYLDRTCVPIHDPLFYLHFLCVSKQTLRRYPCNMIGPAKQEYLISGVKTALYFS
jgi:hypothetical protein